MSIKIDSSKSINAGVGISVIPELGTWGSCACGGTVLYYSDFGVRCDKCRKLYGTWVENLKKAKEEEKQKKIEIERKIEIKKFDDEMAI